MACGSQSLKSPQIETCLACGAFRTKAALTVSDAVDIEGFSTVTAFSGGFGEGGCVNIFGEAAAAVGCSFAMAAAAIDCLGNLAVVGDRGASGGRTCDAVDAPSALAGFCPGAATGVGAFGDTVVGVDGGLGVAARTEDFSGSAGGVSGFRLPGSAVTGFWTAASVVRVPGALVNRFFDIIFLFEFFWTDVPQDSMRRGFARAREK